MATEKKEKVVTNRKSRKKSERVTESAESSLNVAISPSPIEKRVVSAQTISEIAYFKSQERQRLGLPADPHADWMETEREALAA